VLESVIHGAVRESYKILYRQKFIANEKRRSGLDKVTNYRPFSRTKSIFIHIPKTAGVSVCKILYGVDIIGHAKLRHYQIVFNHRAFSSYFKFCFVRNPWDRLYSAYRFLMLGGWHEADRKWAEYNLHKFSSFEDFVLNGLADKSILSEVHLQPQYPYIMNFYTRKSGMDFIGRFERLNEDFDFVANKIGVQASLTHQNSSGNDVDYREMYSLKMRMVVEHFYGRDIHIFNYQF